MRLLILILLLPLAEIAGFVIVGDAVGVLNTLALVILTGLIGIVLVRRQGLDTLRRAQARMDKGEPPVREAFDGVCLALAGILLIVPGFLTDLLGVLLFLPPVRSFVFKRTQVRVDVAGARGRGPQWRGEGQPRYRGPGIIEADYTEVEPANDRPDDRPDDRMADLPPPDSRWRPPPKE